MHGTSFEVLKDFVLKQKYAEIIERFLNNLVEQKIDPKSVPLFRTHGVVAASLISEGFIRPLFLN